MSEEVIIERLDNLKKENDESHNRIETQVIKTNGRVRLLEKFIWALGGGLSILCLLFNNLFFPMIKDIQAKINDMNTTIDERINKKLGDIKTDSNGYKYIEIE